MKNEEKNEKEKKEMKDKKTCGANEYAGFRAKRLCFLTVTNTKNPKSGSVAREPLGLVSLVSWWERFVVDLGYLAWSENIKKKTLVSIFFYFISYYIEKKKEKDQPAWLIFEIDKYT